MTGTALFDITDIEKGENPVLLWTEEVAEHDFYEFIHNLVNRYSDTEKYTLDIVCENFIITVQTAKLGAGTWSLRYIGALELLAKLGNLKMTLQQPAQKDFAPNDRLKALGFWHKGGGGHALDALRHAVIYMVMKCKWRPKELLDDDTVDN